MISAPENMPLPEGWRCLLTNESAHLLDALQREVGTGHVLYGRTVKAIARPDASDDVLYQEPLSTRCWLVHLTWGQDDDPTFPWTVGYSSIADFTDAWCNEQNALRADI